MYMGIEEMRDADIKRGSATGDGNTVFALGWTPPSEQSLWVTINGVTQQDSAYTVSGSNITFATAPTTGDVHMTASANSDLEVVMGILEIT
jgi:hypothetical protein